jgi:RimJ/RimL family protein N-acetyltransferase
MAEIRLRPLTLDDVDHVMTWVNEPDIVGNFAAFSGEPFTREQELAYLTKLIASPNDRVFSIERDDGAYVGQVGVHQIHWPSRVGRLSCIIGARAHMGRGHGTAAIGALLDRAFGELELHKIWLMIFATNARSYGIYRRIGFVEEGLLREEYFHRGAWHDMKRMGLLAREWIRREAAAPPPVAGT